MALSIMLKPGLEGRMMTLFDRLRAFSRRFPMFMSVGIMVAMPSAGYFMNSASHAYRSASERIETSRNRSVELETAKSRAAEYRKSLDELKQFAASVTENRLDERQGWTRYAVEIKERLVSEAELHTLLNHLTSSSRYHFKPGKLEITSLTAREGLPPRLLARLRGVEKGAEPAPVPGEKVLISLTGHYLVSPPG
ncbi:MAG: hypothetical protein HQL86_07880 [Magnetococcales bacterium]|nr:hypothetical protein [Magnetococcales bacterium]